jgi:TRAP-type uncharacterized transport system fused permease subunit
MFGIDIDGYARVCLLQAYEKEPRLLATINQLVRRIRRGTIALANKSHI